MKTSDKLRIVLLFSDENLAQDIANKFREQLKLARPEIVIAETMKRALQEAEMTATHLILAEQTFPGGTIQVLSLALGRISGELQLLGIRPSGAPELEMIPSYEAPITNWTQFQKWVSGFLPDSYQLLLGIKKQNNEVVDRLNKYGSNLRQSFEAKSKAIDLGNSVQSAQFQLAPMYFMNSKFSGDGIGETQALTREHKTSVSRKDFLIYELLVVITTGIIAGYLVLKAEDVEWIYKSLAFGVFSISVLGFFASRGIHRFLS